MDLSSCLFSLLCLSTVLAELQLAVVSPKTAILGSDTLLECTFTVGTSRVDFQYLAITWRFKGRELLRYKDRLEVFDSRGRINEAKIADGNASLQLSELRLSHEGDYTCSVIYSPDIREKTITLILQVAELQLAVVSPKTAILGSDTLLECTFTVGTSRVDFQYLAITWRFKGRELLRYKDRLEVFDSRVSIDEAKIADGNASLKLSGLRLSQEGEYTCSVIYSPDRIEKTITLNLQAHPRIIIQEPILIKGKENLLRCSVVGFYPMEISVFWSRDGQILPGSSMSQLQTYTNGTFMVNCTLPIIPTDSEVNHNFSCRVYHSSLVGPLEKDVVLVLQEEERSGRVMVVVLSLLVVVVIVAVLGCFLYRRLDFPGRPRLDDIVVPPLLHGFEASLQCRVAKYFPKELQVEWLKVEKASNGHFPPSDASLSLDLLSNDLSCGKQECINITHEPGKGYSCTACLTFTPDLRRDQGSEFICRVSHPSLKEALEKSTGKLKVLSEPKVDALKIDSFREKEIRTLLLDVYGFYPGKVTILWTYDTQGERTGLLSALNVTEEGDGTYSAQSRCQLTSKDRKKIGKTPTVTIEHEALREPLTLTVTLKNKGNDWTLVSQNFSWAPKNPLPHTIKDKSQARRLQGAGWPWLSKDGDSRAMAH